nr:hypothetical protein [uncultured Desulfobacter sp.]
MTDISKKILQRIKQDNIRPYPKCCFLFKRSIIWTFFSFSVLFGSIATGIALFQLKHAEWDLYQHLRHSLLEFILLTIPCFWLVFMAGFTGFAYYYFRHTEQGYRYNTLWIVSGSIILSIIGGGLCSLTPAPERIETIFQDKVPFYKALEEYKHKVWMSPEHGLLAGKINKVISEQKIQIEDLAGNNVLIDITHATWKGGLTPVENLKIKIICHRENKSLFIADEIRPWEGRRHRGGKCQYEFR